MEILKKISEEIKNLIIRLREEGKKISEIAITTKTSESSVGRVLRENNVETPESINEKAVKKITKGVDINDPTLQVFFNLNRVAKECGSNLFEFLQKVEYTYNEMLKITNRPHELYLWLIDLASTVFSLNFEKPEVVEKIIKLVDKGIFLFGVEDQIKRKKQELEGFCKVFYEAKTQYNRKLAEISGKIKTAAYFHKGGTEPNTVSKEDMFKIAQILLNESNEL